MLLKLTVTCSLSHSDCLWSVKSSTFGVDVGCAWYPHWKCVIECLSNVSSNWKGFYINRPNCCIMYCMLLCYCTLVYYTLLYAIVLYASVRYYTVPYCTLLYCPALYFTNIVKCFRKVALSSSAHANPHVQFHMDWVCYSREKCRQMDGQIYTQTAFSSLYSIG